MIIIIRRKNSFRAETFTHLCKVEIHEAEGEELEADWEAVEQPEGEGSQRVGGHKVLEVEGKEHGAQGGPQQTQGQKGGLVAEAFVTVPQYQPELDVDEDEEEGVEDGVRHRQAQRDVRRHSRAQGGQRPGTVGKRRLLHRGLHDLLSPERRRRNERGRPAFAARCLSRFLARRRGGVGLAVKQKAEENKTAAETVRKGGAEAKQGWLPAAEPDRAGERGT